MENTHLVFYPEASEFSKNTYEFEPCRMYR